MNYLDTSKWAITHSKFLRSLGATDEPLWTSGPDVWEPAISEAPSVTVVGGREAKREKVRIVLVADSLQVVNEDLLDSPGALAADLPRICALDPRGPPILDVRLHKALTYFLEIRPHYGAPLWAGVDRGAEGVDLEAWDEAGDLPCAAWPNGRLWITATDVGYQPCPGLRRPSAMSKAPRACG